MPGRTCHFLTILSGSLVLSLSACGSDPVPPTSADAEAPLAAPLASKPEVPVQATLPGLPEGYGPIAFDLAGSSWLVVAIDGAPLAERYSDLATVHFTRSMLTWQGCNHHEGLYVPTRTSFAVGAMTASLTTCPPESPDSAMARVLGGRPLIGRNIEGKIVLSAAGRTLTLSQIESGYRESAPPPLEAGPFRLLVADGGTHPPVLSFKGGRFSVWLDCGAAISGRASVTEGKMRTGQIALGTCQTHRPTARKALADFFAANPAISRGPNGELLLTDGETLVSGRQCYPDPGPCGHAVDRAVDRPLDQAGAAVTGA